MPTLHKPTLRIGETIDYEEVALNNSTATGDDNDVDDDEDGVQTFVAGCDGGVKIYNDFDVPTYLHYWMDANDNKTFEKTGPSLMTYDPADPLAAVFSSFYGA